MYNRMSSKKKAESPRHFQLLVRDIFNNWDLNASRIFFKMIICEIKYLCIMFCVTKYYVSTLYVYLFVKTL